MASRVARHVFSPAIRASLRSRITGPTIRVGRKSMSSSHASPKQSSDMPWIITSAVVFGPAFLYLLSPSARKPATHHDDSHASSHDSHSKKTLKDDEGTEADVTSSIENATAEDSPKNADKPPSEPVAEKADEASGSEAVEASSEQTSDNKTADAGPDSGLSSQTSDSETDVEQKEKPTPEKSGTVQSESDSGPTNQEDARSAAKEKSAPKEAEKES